MKNFPREALGCLEPAALSAWELDSRLGQLDRGEILPDLFWTENLAAFRQTLAAAARDTADLLGCATISRRAELKLQLELLHSYERVVDVYIAARGPPMKPRPN